MSLHNVEERDAFHCGTHEHSVTDSAVTLRHPWFSMLRSYSHEVYFSPTLREEGSVTPLHGCGTITQPGQVGAQVVPCTTPGNPVPKGTRRTSERGTLEPTLISNQSSPFRASCLAAVSLIRSQWGFLLTRKVARSFQGGHQAF